MDELDDRVDLAREEIAAARACTEDDHRRIRDMEHQQFVTWGYRDEDDWRRRA